MSEKSEDRLHTADTQELEEIPSDELFRRRLERLQSSDTVEVVRPDVNQGSAEGSGVKQEEEPVSSGLAGVKKEIQIATNDAEKDASIRASILKVLKSFSEILNLIERIPKYQTELTETTHATYRGNIERFKERVNEGASLDYLSNSIRDRFLSSLRSLHKTYSANARIKTHFETAIERFEAILIEIEETSVY